jgi:hypothetical protein
MSRAGPGLDSRVSLKHWSTPIDLTSVNGGSGASVKQSIRVSLVLAEVTREVAEVVILSRRLFISWVLDAIFCCSMSTRHAVRVAYMTGPSLMVSPWFPEPRHAWIYSNPVSGPGDHSPKLPVRISSSPGDASFCKHNSACGAGLWTSCCCTRVPDRTQRPGVSILCGARVTLIGLGQRAVSDG